MSDHEELVAEMVVVERLPTSDRHKRARKKRAQQLKKFSQYEKQLEKDATRKNATERKSKTSTAASGVIGKNRRRVVGPPGRVRFVHNIVLLEAATRNDIDEVRALLQQGVSPDTCNEDGLTALHQCCIDNSEDMVKLLIEYGANVDARDSELWTPLHAAATCAHVHLCRLLIENNANLLAVNADSNMPYDICEDELTLDYIESEMSKRGVTQEQIDDLRLSREKMMLNDLERVSQRGGDLEFRGRQGETPLHIAAANGYLQVAEFLVGRDVTIDCVDNDTWQPIHCAACWGQLPVLELLLEHGASLEAKTKFGETPLDMCEDSELKQRIEEIKMAIETSRLAKSRELSRKRNTNIRSSVHSTTGSINTIYSSNPVIHIDRNPLSASIRRTSMRDKNALSWKEAREEAQKLRESANNVESTEEEDEESKSSSPTSKNYINGQHPGSQKPVLSSNDIKLTIAPGSNGGLHSSDNAAADQKVLSTKLEKSSTSAAAVAVTDGRQAETNRVSSGNTKIPAVSVIPPPAADRGGQQQQSTSPAFSGDGATTLAELKRQRAGSRDAPTSQKSSSDVGNGGSTGSGDGESLKFRFTAPTDSVELSGKEDNRCCVII